MQLAHEKGKLPRFRIRLPLGIELPLWAAPVEKDVLLPRVTMEIDEHGNLLLLVGIFYELLEEEDFGMQFLAAFLPLAVQVEP